MKYFKSVYSYINFEKSVLRNRRYIFNKESNEFLKIVSSTAKSRITTIDKGSKLARAQLGCVWHTTMPEEIEIPWPYSIERMKPLLDKSKEGRLNPKGIPVLYMADSVDTAVGEVRPHIGSYVSVGVFLILENLRMIDCGEKQKYIVYLKEQKPKERDKAVWWNINRAFTKPIRRSDDSAEYEPTQIIAELFKSEGYNGIIYRSAFGKGKNYVIFNLDYAKLEYCFVVEIIKSDVIFEKYTGSYYKNK